MPSKSSITNHLLHIYKHDSPMLKRLTQSAVSAMNVGARVGLVPAKVRYKGATIATNKPGKICVCYRTAKKKKAKSHVKKKAKKKHKKK